MLLTIWSSYARGKSFVTAARVTARAAARTSASASPPAALRREELQSKAILTWIPDVLIAVSPLP